MEIRLSEKTLDARSLPAQGLPQQIRTVYHLEGRPLLAFSLDDEIFTKLSHYRLLPNSSFVHNILSVLLGIKDKVPSWDLRHHKELDYRLHFLCNYLDALC